MYVPFVLNRWLLVASCSTGLLSCAACGGSGKTTVPDLQGQNFGQSTKALGKRGLCAPSKVVIYGDSSGANEATVVAQDPGPGARVDRGTHVTLTLHWSRERGSSDRVDPSGVCPGR